MTIIASYQQMSEGRAAVLQAVAEVELRQPGLLVVTAPTPGPGVNHADRRSRSGTEMSADTIFIGLRDAHRSAACCRAGPPRIRLVGTVTVPALRVPH